MRRSFILATAVLAAVQSAAQVNATWSNPAGGTWTTSTNWSGGVVPNAATASATIDLPGTYTVTASTPVNLATFNLNATGATFALQTGATFTAATANLNLGTLTGTSANIAAAGGTWNVAPAARFALNGATGTLANIRVNGAIDLTSTSLTIGSNVTVGRLRPSAISTFINVANLDATIDLSDPSSQSVFINGNGGTNQFAAGNVLRISSPTFLKNVVIDRLFSAGSSQSFTNRGLIELTGGNANASVIVRNLTFDNQGVIRVNSGRFTFATVFTTVANYGNIQLGGTGVLAVGAPSKLSSFTNLQRTGGTFELTGVLDFENSDIVGTLPIGTITSSGGTLSNGAWTPGSGDYVITTSMGLINFNLRTNVVLGPDSKLDVQSANCSHGDIALRYNRSEYAANPYTSPMTPLATTIVADGTDAGTRLISGSVSVGPTGVIRMDPQLPAGSELTIERITSSAGLILNEAPGTTLRINFFGVNTGTIRATTGTLVLSLPNGSSGSIGTLDLSPNVNLVLAGGTLLQPLSTGTAPVIEGAGLGAALISPQSITYKRGNITGAAELRAPTVTATAPVTGAGSLLIVADNFQYSSIQIGGTLRISTPQAFALNPAGTVSAGGVTIDKADDTFVVPSPLTLSGPLTLPSNTTQIVNDSTIVVTAGGSFSIPVVNRGVVRYSGFGLNSNAFVSNGRIEIAASTNIVGLDPGATLVVSAGGSAQLLGTYSLTGRNFELTGGTTSLNGTLLAGDGVGNWSRAAGTTVYVDANVDLQNTTLALGMTGAGPWRSFRGTFRNGTLNLVDPAALAVPFFSNSSTVRFRDLTLTNPYTISAGGITLAGTVTAPVLTVAGGRLSFDDGAAFSGRLKIETNVAGTVFSPVQPGTFTLAPGGVLSPTETNPNLVIGIDKVPFSIRNQGTIETGPGQSLQILLPLVNEGVIGAAPGTITSIRYLRGGNGTVNPAPGGVVELFGTLGGQVTTPVGGLVKFGGTVDADQNLAGSFQFAANSSIAPGRTFAGTGEVALAASSLTLRSGSSVLAPLTVGSDVNWATVVVNGVNAALGRATAGPGGGRISLSTAATLTVTRLDRLRVAMNSRSRITFADSSPNASGDPAMTSILISLAMVNGPAAADVLVDLRNNDLIIRNGLTTLQDVRLLSRRFIDTGGTAGLGSSRADSLALSFGLAGDLGLTSFNTYAVAPDDIVIKYTYAGDANLDGQVDGTDLAIWQAFAGQSPLNPSPARGDFDFNGTVDNADLAIWQANQGQGVGQSIAIPEPGVLGGAALTSLALLRRRRNTRGPA